MKKWLEICQTINIHTEDPVTYRVLADMVMEEGDQELLKHTYFSLVKDVNKLVAYEEECHAGMEYEPWEEEYRRLTDDILVLKEIAVHIFEECDWCEGCQADPQEMDWCCKRCVNGINFNKARTECCAAGKT